MFDVKHLRKSVPPFLLSRTSFASRLNISYYLKMTQKSDLGKLGENLACQYLIKKGYKIIERNYRKPWGELDIVALSPDKTLVFVEVKTVTKNNSGISAEDQLTITKLKKLKRTTSLYVGYDSSSIKKLNNIKEWRIDLLALTIEGKNCVVKHYKNIT